MDTVDLRFSRVLKKLRKSKGLTQEALAQRAGVDYKYLQKFEGRDPSSPTLVTLEKIAHGLELSLVDLINLLASEEI